MQPSALPIVGDCRRIPLPDESVDAVVTDPPYGLSFMGREWDHDVPGPDYWREVYRVMKPGAHLLAFGGTRTWHWLTVGIEEAGFEIRDCLSWMYGTGFPKSHDISKAIDKAAGAEREVVGSYTVQGTAAKGKHKGRATAAADEGSADGCSKELDITAPATEEARAWDGWGTALKPSWEPVVWAQKELKPIPSERVLYRDLNNLIGGVLCLLLSDANSAETVLRSSQAVLPEETSASVAMLVALIAGKKSLGRSEMMDMSSSPETVSTCLSIATLWSSTLAELWSRGSTSTTETATEAITALRTLRSLLSGIMPECTVRAASQVSGQPWNATDAGSGSTDEKASSRAETIATVIATWMPSETSSSAKSAVKDLRRQIPTVVSALQHALTASTAASGASESALSGNAPTAESGSLRSRLDPLNTATESAWPNTTNLVPDWEPIVLAMKPTDGTFAENALEHGVAGLNVDGCRVGTETISKHGYPGEDQYGALKGKGAMDADPEYSSSDGRWPANVTLSHTRWCRKVGTKRVKGTPRDARFKDKYGDGDDRFLQQISGSGKAGHADEDGKEEVEDWDCPPSCPVRMLDGQSGELKTGRLGAASERGMWGTGEAVDYADHDSGGGASRFYYCSKASRGEREAGLPNENGSRANHHPTVKPIDLCRWLVRLVTRPGHLVLDPFMGSGSIGCAALQERRRYIGLDLEPEYVEIARARLRHWTPKQVDMFQDQLT